MATRAESLIRQFCFNRRNEIQTEANAARKCVPEYILVKSLPPPVQTQLTRLRRLREEADEIQTKLVKLGFSSFELQRPRTRLTNPGRNKAHEHINTVTTERLGKLNALQQAAYVQVMGRTPGEARIVVEELQKALVKL